MWTESPSLRFKTGRGAAFTFCYITKILMIVRVHNLSAVVVEAQDKKLTVGSIEGDFCVDCFYQY